MLLGEQQRGRGGGQRLGTRAVAGPSAQEGSLLGDASGRLKGHRRVLQEGPNPHWTRPLRFASCLSPAPPLSGVTFTHNVRGGAHPKLASREWRVESYGVLIKIEK